MSRPIRKSAALLSVRTTIVLASAAIAGGLIGGLAWLAGRNAAQAAVAGLVAFAGAVTFFDRHVGPS